MLITYKETYNLQINNSARLLVVKAQSPDNIYEYVCRVLVPQKLVSSYFIVEELALHEFIIETIGSEKI